jgi:hypothetical protein
MITLPLWFVSERDERPPLSAAPRDEPPSMIAFSTTENLSNFLSKCQWGEWKVNLASDREGLILVIAIAHNKGIESISIDPECDGVGGELVSLCEMMKLVNALRTPS